MRSDAHIIHDWIVANKPTAFTSTDLFRALKRDDNTQMTYGSISAACTVFRKRGLITVVDKVAADGLSGRFKYVYGFVALIPQPIWHDNVMPHARPSGYKKAAKPAAVVNTGNGQAAHIPAATTTTKLSDLLMDMAGRVEELERQTLSQVPTERLMSEVVRRFKD